jgi:pyruvate dehydrogenase E2 component (dihydrolipoyllysine-residue acetyltransferase)
MDILMPQLGETVTEGKITTWFKSIGDAVKPGDNLFEIETDKVSMEVPATAAGTLTDIRVVAGEVAPVGAVVAVLAGPLPNPPPQAGEGRERAAAPAATVAAVTAPAPPLPNPSPLQAPSLPSAAGGGGLGTGLAGEGREGAAPAPPAAPLRIMLDPFQEVRTPERNYGPARLASGAVATPLARRLAGEAGIDLAGVLPSGPDRRIVARDVETAIAAGAGTLARGPAPSPDRIKALYKPGSYEEIPLDGMRRMIVARLVEAQTIPHFYLTADVAFERLEAVREEANSAAPADPAGTPAFRLSIDDFIVKALALALQRVPGANAVWAEDRILRFKRSDIGVAVPIEGGRVMPVIRGAEKKPLLEISAELNDLVDRAGAGKLKPAELQGGASAICNLGMHGIREFAAIINPPHATFLAVGAGARRPIETEDGGFRFVSQMTMTLSCDHRVVDAAVGAELIGALRHFIEHPVGLMI